MAVKPLVLALSSALAGYVARGAPEPPPIGVPAHAEVPTTHGGYITTARDPSIEIERGDDDDASDGIEVADLIARANQLAPAARPAATGIRGTVTDPRSHDLLAGVTICVTSTTIAQTYSAVTDEHGAFALSDVPAGVYEVVVYYADFSARQSSVTVRSYDLTTLDVALDQQAERERMDAERARDRAQRELEWARDRDGITIETTFGQAISGTYEVEP